MMNLIKIALCSVLCIAFIGKESIVSFENKKIKILIIQNDDNIEIFIKNKDKQAIYIQEPKTNITINREDKDIAYFTSDLNSYNPHVLIVINKIAADSTFKLVMPKSSYFIYECVPISEKIVFKQIKNSEKRALDTIEVKYNQLFGFQYGQEVITLSNVE